MLCSALCSSCSRVVQRAISANPGIVKMSTYLLYARVSVVMHLSMQIPWGGGGVRARGGDLMPETIPVLGF